ncbi:hypothetical protein XBP1_2570006 [Xenorhabdus bovienii str. puntauvense]|uniref:Uncharacterized protein n=1 Tax=Xenorhabdus bovienii str. puntauvense TaxID=1398201 RepID=A0A077NG44_XENBV|nr:hypothetical protein XBFFR1_960006 [Xenorhabdus bovienii str. feltiae France]CDG94302.1 hypothetical protein XBFFL1_400006 [Xenorhabdus bovienii str. feltiae Florida]CDG97353.1 hypothetical protein XBP1_2570006 [Xenorhabdus bovienii str. puntauvense]
MADNIVYIVINRNIPPLNIRYFHHIKHYYLRYYRAYFYNYNWQYFTLN